MTRWWADPAAAEGVLSVVDDSDVVQGVAACALGYHALSTRALAPLAGQTLVDGALVRQALDTVDLSPVAKALANATRPVMREGADRYGELLAQELHDRASDATGKLIVSLTNSGVPWPQAVVRASDVHGVTLDQLGRYAHAMRAPVVAPINREDAADRALMLWAKEVGEREADGAISKSIPLRGSDLSDFNAEHPRDEAGKFTRGGTPRDERRDRRMRRNRRVSRVAADVRAKATRDAVETSSLSALSRLLPSRRLAERKQPERQTVTRTMAARATAAREVNARMLEEARKEPAPPQEKPAPPKAKLAPTKEKPGIDDLSKVADAKYATDHRYSDGAVYIPLTLDQAREFAKGNRLAIGSANEAWGTELRAYSQAAAEKLIQDAVNNEGADHREFIMLRMSGGVYVTDESPESEDGGAISPGTLLEHYLTPDITGNDTTLYESHDSLNVTLYEDEDGDVEQAAIPVMDVTEGSMDEYRFLRDKTGWNSHWAPKSTEWRGSKSLDWDADEHPRSEDGRFASSGGNFRDPRIERQRRRARRGSRSKMSRASVVTEHHRPAPEREMARRDVRRIPLTRMQEARLDALVRRMAPRGLPQGASVSLTEQPRLIGDRNVAQTNDALGPRVLTHVEERREANREMYERRMQRFREAEGLLTKAFNGATMPDENEILRRMFTQPHEGKEALTPDELQLAVKQLGLSYAMHKMQVESGASGWQMELPRSADDAIARSRAHSQHKVLAVSSFMEEVTGYGGVITTRRSAEERQADEYRVDYDENDYEKYKIYMRTLSAEQRNREWGKNKEQSPADFARAHGFHGAARHLERMEGRLPDAQGMTREDHWRAVGQGLDPAKLEAERAKRAARRLAFEQSRDAAHSTDESFVDEGDAADAWLRAHEPRRE